MANRNALSNLKQTLKGGLDRLFNRTVKEDQVVSEETLNFYRKRREFMKSQSSKPWVDVFGDTVFPEFEKPETWNQPIKPGE